MINETIDFIKDFHPFPVYTDRQGWEAVAENIKAFYRERGKELLGHEWPALPATLYLDFYRNGNRSRYEGRYFQRRLDVFCLMMAECIAGNGACLDDLINGVWAICEESTWVVPAHNNHDRRRGAGALELANVEEDRYVDLFAAETGALLSWVYFFLGNAIATLSPLVKRRIELEVEQRILLPYLKHNDWGWMGLDHDNPVNNWNSWINSNMLVCYLVFTGVFPQAREGVEKTIHSVNRFIHFYADDGGCDEGPSYFDKAGGSLFDYVEELGECTDLSYFYKEQRIRNIASYIYKVYISRNFFVNYADADPTVAVPLGLLSRTAVNTGDENLLAFCSYLREHKYCADRSKPVGNLFSVYRILADIFKPLTTTDKAFVAPPASWFPGIQVATARDNREGGLFFSAKGGHNAESHNHNDVGTFLLYCGEQPVLVDAGRETYTKFTFSEKRYTIWTNQSSYHNLPLINGFDQSPGVVYNATNVRYSFEEGITRFNLDIAGAYPQDAAIQSYTRDFVFDQRLTITDRYTLKAWKAPLTLHFLCHEQPEIAGGRVVLSGVVELAFDAATLQAAVDEIPLTDIKLRRGWQKDSLYRLRLTLKDCTLSGAISLRFARI